MPTEHHHRPFTVLACMTGQCVHRLHPVPATGRGVRRQQRATRRSAAQNRSTR